MQDILQDAITEFEAPPVAPTKDILGEAVTEFETAQKGISKAFQYDPDMLKTALTDYFKDNPYADQRFVRQTRGKPWKLEDTPAWGIGKGVAQGARGLATATITNPLTHSESAYGKKPRHGGAWENIRYYAGWLGPLHLAASATETIGEVAQGIYMIANGSAQGISGGMYKAFEAGANKLGMEVDVERQTKTYNEIGDFLQNKITPYERKRALVSTMSVLMSDDVQAIESVLDAHTSEDPHSVRTIAGESLGMRTGNKQYTEADIAKALTELKEEYDGIHMTPEDWAVANAFWEGFTGHYTSAEAFEEKMRSDPGEVALDLIDVWEVATGLKNVSKMGRAIRDATPLPTAPQDIPTAPQPNAVQRILGDESGAILPDETGRMQAQLRNQIEQLQQQRTRAETDGNQQLVENIDNRIAEIEREITERPAFDQMSDAQLAQRTRNQVSEAREPTGDDLMGEGNTDAQIEQMEAAQRIHRPVEEIRADMQRLEQELQNTTDESERMRILSELDTLTRSADAVDPPSIRAAQNRQGISNELARRQGGQGQGGQTRQQRSRSIHQEAGNRVDALRQRLDELYQQRDMANTEMVNSRSDEARQRVRQLDAEILPVERELEGVRQQLRSAGEQPQMRRQRDQMMVFLAQQDPNQINFTNLSQQQLNELLEIADEAGNENLVAAIVSEEGSRRGQYARNESRRGGQVNPESFFDDLVAPGRRADTTSPTAGNRLDPSDPRNQGWNPNVSQRAAEAAQQRATTNKFDDETQFADAEAILARMDEIRGELDDLDTPRRAGGVNEGKQALEQELSLAMDALRRRMPARGRGMRLNMGIDPTQLPTAARELWRSLRRFVQERVAEPKRMEFPTQDRTRDLNRTRETDVDNRIDRVLETGEPDESLSTLEVLGGGAREQNRRVSERNLRRSLAEGDIENYPMASGGLSDEDTLLQNARDRDAGGHRSELSRSDVDESLGRQTTYDFGDTAQYPDPDSILDRMRTIETEAETLNINDVETAYRLLDELEAAQNEIEWRAEQVGEGETQLPTDGTRLYSGIDPTLIVQTAKDLWQKIVEAVRKIVPKIQEHLKDESGFIRLNPDRPLSEDISSLVTGLRKGFDFSGGQELGEKFGKQIAEGMPVREALGELLGQAADHMQGRIAEAAGDRLYNRRAAKGDVAENALRELYEQVGLKADDATIAEHLKNLEEMVGEGSGASIAVDILSEVQDMTIERVTHPELKNLIDNKLTQRGTPTKQGRERINANNTIEAIENLRSILGESEYSRFAGQQDPPARKIRGMLDTTLAKYRTAALTADSALLDTLLDTEEFGGHPFIEELRGRNEEVTGSRDLTSSDRQLLSELIANARENPNQLTLDLGPRGNQYGEHFFETIKQNPQIHKHIDLQNKQMSMHELVDFWRAIYDRFFRQQARSEGLDHPDIVGLTDAIQQDLRAWADEKNPQGKLRSGRVSIRNWLNDLESRQHKVTQAFRKTVVKQFADMRPQTFFDTFASMDKNTIRGVLDMLGEREDNVPRIPINKRQQFSDAYTDAELKRFLQAKGQGVRERGRTTRWSPVEKLDILRTVMVDQLLEKTYARSRKSTGRDNPMQAKDSDVMYIHTLQELLDDIDLRDGESTGKGELIFGTEIWNNLREMKPTNELYHWLTTAQGKLRAGRGGLGLRIGAGATELLTALLPFLRSTEHGKEFYRNITSNPITTERRWSNLVKKLFEQGRKRTKTRVAARTTGRTTQAAQDQQRRNARTLPPWLQPIAP